MNGLKSGKDKSLPWVVVHSVGFETPIRADLHRALSRLPAIHPTKYAILRGTPDAACTGFGTVLFAPALRQAYSSGPSNGH